ncbi:MAG TPA: ankyrin repeat domain-containing protein [Bryobacteraceae bacterium]|jgi:ankyrin repeat protein
MSWHKLSALGFLLTLGLRGATLGESVQTGDRAAVEKLIQQHADVNAADAEGMTPLDLAVRAGDAKMTALLLQAGASAKTSTRDGITPLWLAVMNRNVEITDALLKAGADPNAALPDGETILMTAARAGNAAVAELLIKNGANVAAAGPAFGETALMIAAMANHADVIEVLLKHGAEVNGRSKELSYPKDRFGLEGVLTILPHGSWSPLMYAAREGSVDAARALCGGGAELNAADPDGSSSLLLAITNGHFDTAALLIERGANVNAADSTGTTPLYAAVDMNTLGEIFGRPGRASHDRMNAVDLMKLLLDHGANPNAGLKSAMLQRAHTPGEPTLGEGATPLARAAHTGDVAAIELLLAHGASVSQALKNGTTPLMFAAGLGRGVSAFAKDYGTEADLIAAAKVLLDHGADINAISAAGQTAMHFAAQAADANFPQPSDNMVKLLASRGARLDVVDKQGRSPIEMAQGKGLRGHAGGPVKPREQTVALLRQLMESAPKQSDAP